MSGRIRSIKPELIEDAVTAGISDVAFRLFIGCILLADDYGNLRYEPAWLRGQVYWKHPVTEEAFSAALVELDALIESYVVKEQRYGAIRNWKKHQKVAHPGKPRVPGISESFMKPSRDSHEGLVPDHRSPITDHRPQSATESVESESQESTVRLRPFSLGGCSSIEAKDAYEQAVSSVTGKPFVLTDWARSVPNIVTAINTHGKPESLQAGLSWLRIEVSRWVSENRDRAQFMSGWKPGAFVDWLNSGCPKPKTLAATGTSDPARQPRPMFKNPGLDR
jgi:hypothetical protein